MPIEKLRALLKLMFIIDKLYSPKNVCRDQLHLHFCRANCSAISVNDLRFLIGQILVIHHASRDRFLFLF